MLGQLSLSYDMTFLLMLCCGGGECIAVAEECIAVAECLISRKMSQAQAMITNMDCIFMEDIVT